MKVHFIAIGGSAMHNLAIALKRKGYDVSGSDDEIFEPSRGRLASYGLLPSGPGWDQSRITKDLDAVILGMHARQDNPELIRARELGLKIFSYPEYLYEVSREKIRVVIGGSHGKTTITSMVLHVLKYSGIECDYMVGAQLEGFDVMVRLSSEANFMILEGDEYLSSILDPRPKFHLYKPHIALISGIAWDHINVFPTFENYVEQFILFAEMIEKDGKLIYCEEDPQVVKVAKSARKDISLFPYSSLPFMVNKGLTYLLTAHGQIPLHIFGKHNMQNLGGALEICRQLGVSDHQFFKAIKQFKGASKRLQLLRQNDHSSIFKDFAHSPSKLKATIDAVKQQFPERQLVACLELHTYSSLNREFLSQYRKAMDGADYPYVYFNPHTISLKKLPPISEDDIREAFENQRLKIFTDSVLLKDELLQLDYRNKSLLMMSSGNFDGIDMDTLAEKIMSMNK